MELQLLNNYHGNLLKKVESEYPVVKKATEIFNKSQSQFMDNMLTISQLTPARSARQCLAEIKKIKLAIEESFFKVKKNQILIGEKKVFISENSWEIELNKIEVAEMIAQNENIIDNVNGAVRKMSAFMAQYKNILERAEKEEFSEEDFEKDEERYHIMKAFEQGLNAARSRGGTIDEGNLIYLFQIGVSGTAAQMEIKIFLDSEIEYMKKKGMPPHSTQVDFLVGMADKYAGCAQKFAEFKGVTLLDNNSLVTRRITDG